MGRAWLSYELRFVWITESRAHEAGGSGKSRWKNVGAQIELRHNLQRLFRTCFCAWTSYLWHGEGTGGLQETKGSSVLALGRSLWWWLRNCIKSREKALGNEAGQRE
jgi:hypothetical protein